MKKIYFIVGTIIIGLYILNEVRKKRFSIKESFYWILGVLLMLVLAIFPQCIDFLAIYLGVAYPPSLLFVICILFLVLMNFRNSKRITKQQEEIVELEQNLAILKDKVKKNVKK